MTNSGQEMEIFIVERTNYVRFSAHAFERVGERLSLSPDQVAVILLSKTKSVFIGIQKNRNSTKNRYFRLFWSIPDKQFFVTIEATDGTVITVLPKTWVEWMKVSSTVMADIIAASGDSPRTVMEETTIGHDVKVPQNYVFGFCFVSTAKKGVWRMKNMSIPISEYPDYLERIRDFEKCEPVMQRLKEFALHKIRPDEFIDYVNVRIGQKGEPERIELEC